MGDLDRSWLVRSALLCLVLLLCVARNYFGSTDQIQNADALAAAVMLQSGKPVRISLGRRRSSPAGAYSQWMCVGNLEEIGSIEHRTCLFENVCYNKDESDFVFFERPGNVSMPVIFDHRHGSQHRFRWRRRDGQPMDSEFAALNKWVPYKPRVAWSAQLRQGPVPKDHELIAGTTALSAPFVSTNFGHVAWDEAFPLLVAMAQLGAYVPELNVLRTRACEDQPLRSNSSKAICRKFARAFIAPLIGPRMHAQRLDAELPTLAAAVGASRNRLVCFEKLIVGGSFDAFNSEALNIGKEPLIALFRYRVLEWHGIDPNALPSRHQILLVLKQGRRTISNFRRVESFVRERYSDAARVVVTDYSAMTLSQQLALVSRTTIAISPCGGISMILPFLPNGAHAILLNYMLGPGDERRHGECDGCSWSMEAELWRHVRHVNKMYYQVFDNSDFARSRPGRDASVRVRVERLATLIDAALETMQPS